jgi:hypothetical protein
LGDRPGINEAERPVQKRDCGEVKQGPEAALEIVDEADSYAEPDQHPRQMSGLVICERRDQSVQDVHHELNLFCLSARAIELVDRIPEEQSRVDNYSAAASVSGTPMEAALYANQCQAIHHRSARKEWRDRQGW